MRNTFFIIAIALFFGCEQVATEPEVLFSIPDNLGDKLPTTERNPITEEGVLLGKKLFFDPGLSANGEVSCASCHQPERAFTDGEALTTKGVSGKPLHRNVPTIANVAWVEGLFWDGGALNLESLTFGPLTHEDEMGADLRELVIALKSDEEYSHLFNKAFPELGVSTSGIARALAQYQRTLISGESAYDHFIRGESSTLNGEELKGLQLFEQNCASCHATDHFTDYGYHNNGLDDDFSDDSFEGVFQGRFRITRDSADLGKYKTPTLRNIAVSAPYMHDGRYNSLQEVLDHYRFSVKNSETLDADLKRNVAPGIALTDQEADQIIAFLHTLTDYNFLNTHKEE